MVSPPKPMTQAETDRRSMVANLEFMRESLAEFDHFKNIAGLDPSLVDSAVTVCWQKKPGRWAVQMLSSPAETGSASLSATKRMGIMRRYLRQVFRQRPCQLVAIEGYAYSEKQNRELMGEVGGIIRLCVFHDLPQCVGLVLVVTPHQLKKYAVGHMSRGKSVKKEKILQKLALEYGLEADNNNQGDATVLAIIAKDLLQVVKATDPQQFYDQGEYVDAEVRHFLKDGYKRYRLLKYKWEVLTSLLTSRCDESLFDYRPMEHVGDQDASTTTR